MDGLHGRCHEHAGDPVRTGRRRDSSLNISVVYFFAVLGLSVVGLLVAGWASYNKYSLLGGLRSAAQMVSYEIPLTLSVVGIVILTGTPVNFPSSSSGRERTAGAALAAGGAPHLLHRVTGEINRTPFDMVEADCEIVAGFATEYSGMRFGFFFFAEYVALFIMSTIVVTLFFGGWLPPFFQLPDGFIGTVLGESSSSPRPTSSCSSRSGCAPPCRACAWTS